MSSEVKVRKIDFMDDKSETESLHQRLREVEDENQDLRARNLLQRRTILEMQREVVLLRMQMNEMADTSALLTERVRSLTENASQHSTRTENDGSTTTAIITAPPLMAPPPVPPPLPARIRISPRQVGAGEALTTPLGVSLSCPPRHRIKRDTRQGFYRGTRSNPYRRLDAPEPGPSTATQFFSAERPNYFVGLRIIPQFQTSFVCAQGQPTGYSDSASDSSGSDENPQIFKKMKMKVIDGNAGFKKSNAFSKDFEILKNVRNFQHHKVRQTILQNYNFALPNTNSKFFFPLPRDRKNRDNSTLPSTSGNGTRIFSPENQDNNSRTRGVNNDVNRPQKLSNGTQYTFPTIHEGLHHSGTSSSTNQQQTDTTRLRKLKKNIPYCGNTLSKTSNSKIYTVPKIASENEDEMQVFLSSHKKVVKNFGQQSKSVDSESVSSIDETIKLKNVDNIAPIFAVELSSDFEQDGFQADESSNCMTSNENSLEKITVSESNLEKKDDSEKSNQ